MTDDISITVHGLDKLVANFHRFSHEIGETMGAAGQEAGEEIVNTRGLRRYPPAGPANQPPTPYYIRGRGTQHGLSAKGKATKKYNDMSSERLGTQFYVQTTGYTTKIGNRASYAKHVVGERQARAMGKIGWRRMIDVAREKLPKIQRIYQAWTDRLLRKLDL